MTQQTEMPEFLNVYEAGAFIGGRSKPWMYQRCNPEHKLYDPEFPKPVRLSVRRVAWIKSELSAWLLRQVAKRDASLAEA